MKRKGMDSKTLLILYAIAVASVTWALSSIGFSDNTVLCMIVAAVSAVGLEFVDAEVRRQGKTIELIEEQGRTNELLETIMEQLRELNEQNSA